MILNGTKTFVVGVLLVLFATVNANAQLNLTGKVTDKSGEALAGASVVVDGTYLGVSTQADGSYLFRNLKPGNYRLKVSFIGFETIYRDVKLVENQKMNFELISSAVFTDEVIVAATRVGSTTPVAVTNLSKEKLTANATGQDIPYLLSLTPSMVNSSETGTGIGYTALRVRGTDPTRINVTIDGVPLNDAESQGVFWVNMPDFANSVDNVQIQRGVGTSTNGGAAFGATINFQTESFQKKSYAEVSSNIGSFNTFKNSVKVGSGLIDGRFSVNARYSKLKSDGFVDRGFVDHQSLFVSGAYYTENSLIKANIIHGDQHTGITWWGNDDVEGNGRKYNPAGKYTDENGKEQFYDNQTDNYKQTHYTLHYSTKLSEWMNLNTSVHYTKGKGYYEQYKEDQKLKKYGLPNVTIGDEEIAKSDLIRQKWLGNDFYGMVFGINYNRAKVNATFGGGWNYYDGDHYGKIIWMRNAGKTEKDHQWYLNNGKKKDFNIYAKTNYQFSKKVTGYVDLQLRQINYDITGLDDDRVDMTMKHNFTFLNPKAGLYFNINDKNSAYASLAIAHREPTRANFKEAKGDPASTPKAEQLFDYELGYEFKGNKSTFGANVYYMYYRDQLVATGEKSNVGYDIMTNVDKSYRLGIELFGGVKLTDWLKWDANITLSKNKILDYVDNTPGAGGNGIDHKELGDTDISYSPGIIGNSIISITPVNSFNIKFISKHVGKQYFDNTSSDDRKIDAYFVNHLRFDYILKGKLFEQVYLFAQINNVFNNKYSNNATGGHWYEDGVDKTWSAYFPQAGVNFMSGITLTF
ncbi:TonB-dependent receptor [Prolixibacteraceae bacterium JC049]|nr:TonB-dependent receptor [Prolixibacteraceae bacterium JC049]